MKQWIRCTLCFLTGLFLILVWSSEPVRSAENIKTSVDEVAGTEDVKEDEVKKVILATTDIKKEKNSFSKMSSNVSESVDLNVGEKVYYGSYSTNYFDVNGKLAYCLEPLKKTPESGVYEVEELKNGLVRKGLYYVYGGPGYHVYQAKYGSIALSSGRSEDEEYCMSHCILSYLYSGSDEAFIGLNRVAINSLKQKVDWIKGLPDPPKSFYAFLFNVGVDGQAMGGIGEEHTGTLEIYKRTNHPEWLGEQSLYSLKGAVFGVFKKGEKEPLWKLETDEKGYARKDQIPIGIYEIMELKSPSGHAISQERREIEVEKNKTVQYECENQAQFFPVNILLQKRDKETGKDVAQGNYSLEGAHFSVKFYNGHFKKNPAESKIVPMKSWILKTDERGELKLSDEYKVEGDPFYRNENDEPVLPLGTITFEEIKAPFGYKVNTNIFVENITATGTKVTDTVFQAPIVEEEPKKGNIQLVKFREDAQNVEEEKDQKMPLEGIVFTITSKTTGWSCEIETDENGYATTKNGFRVLENGKWIFKSQGGLFLDTYIVREKNPPSDLECVKEFEVNIIDEKTSYYILENKKIFAPVKLVKKDLETGKIIPLAGARFELLDANKQPIKMKIYYPTMQECLLFQTDESGSFILPEKLPVGSYYFRELVAPEGYAINQQLIPFTISEEHHWEEPFVVEAEDIPLKGKIKIEKLDQTNGTKIEGVQFEVRAAEDIFTPDGTLRMRKGDVACKLQTDEDGGAQTEELYLGAYEVLEIKQAPGYVLSKEPILVQLEKGNEEADIVIRSLSITNKPTELIIEKVECGTAIPLSGVTFELQKIKTEGEEKTTSENIQETKKYVTDEKGMIKLEYLIPGDYRLIETHSVIGYAKDSIPREFTVLDDGTIEGKDDYKIVVENKKTSIFDTKAIWKENAMKEVESGDEQKLMDQVVFSNLDEEKDYILKGVLMDAATGEKLLYNGNPIVAEKHFKGIDGIDGIEMEFLVATEKFPDTTIVVFEYLYEGDLCISSHEDFQDKDQTVKIMRKPDKTVPTGDSSINPAVWCVILLSCAVISIVCMIIGKRKRYKNQ